MQDFLLLLMLSHYLPAESRDHVKKFIATHYYFEGRGSETTLTRAENLAFRKMVKDFAKPDQNMKVASTTHSNTFKQQDAPVALFDMNQLFGFHIVSKMNDTASLRKPETPEEKFRRLMHESEASLNRAKKIN